MSSMLVMTKIQSTLIRGEVQLFFGEVGGESVLFHSNFYRKPIVNTSDDDPDNWVIVSSPEATSPYGVVTGMFVRGICERTARGPRAVAWCTRNEFEWCEDELARLRQEQAAKVAAEREAVKEELARRAAAAREERAKNPRTFDEAIEFGWKIVPGLDHGRQVVLERQFAGEGKPRRTTKHRPATGKNKLQVSFPRLASTG